MFYSTLSCYFGFFCKRNKLNGIDASLPLYLPACMACPLFGSLLVPSLYTTPATTRCSSCLRVPPLIHSLLICTRGSAQPLRPSPHCSLSSRWSHHRVEMLSNLKRGRGLSRLSRFSLCCVSSSFKDSELNVGRRYFIFFLNCRMNTWTLLL